MTNSPDTYGDAADHTQAAYKNPLPLSAGLYVVATPIGNLRDMTFRAIDVLSGVSVIYCEDTRVSGQLIAAFGIKKPLVRSDAHTENSRSSDIIQRIKNGEAVALITDAGTPAISDPGAMIVHACRTENLPVWPIPGASALTTAFSGSGLVAPAISFIGFLPSKKGPRQKILKKWLACDTAVVCFETASRIHATLENLIELAPARQIVVMREVTKKFESFYAGTPQDVLQQIDEGVFKGEVVLMVASMHQSEQVEPDEEQVSNLLRGALKTMFTKDAVAHVAEQTGLARKDVYKRAIAMDNNEDL